MMRDNARNDREANQRFSAEMEPFAPDPEIAAILVMLEAVAPRPSAEFQELLYGKVRAVGMTRAGLLRRLQQQLSGFVDNYFAPFNGDHDMKRGSSVLVGMIMLVVILVTAIAPSVRAEVIETLRRITLGSSTEVRQIEPLPGELPPGKYPWEMPEGTYWLVETDIGSYGANVLSGQSNEVKSVQSLEEAETLAGVRPLAPTGMPDGYSLSEVKVVPGRQPVFFQFYAGPGADIVIIQTGVGVTTVVSTATDGSIEEVMFDDRRAAWIDGHLLKWEEEGTVFDVGGLGLDLETAVEIGRSLR